MGSHDRLAMEFYVGQKVVYIAKGKFPEWQKLGLSTPVKNGIYTVRELVSFTALPGLRLEEIVNPEVPSREGFHEPAWWVEEFRPLEEKKTDISVFYKILESV